MANQDVLMLATREAAARKESYDGLLSEAASQAAQISRSKENLRRKNKRQDIDKHRRIRDRVELAFQSIVSLCTMGSSPEFQSLIEVRRRPMLFWGRHETSCAGGDMIDVTWKYVTEISITADSVRLANYSATKSDSRLEYTIDDDPYFLRFPYGIEDSFLQRNPLWKIATPYPIDLEEVFDGMESDQIFKPDILFEILVECADSEKLNAFVRSALR